MDIKNSSNYRKNGLISFIKAYSRRGFLRLHIPGHQGRCRFLNKNFAAKFDITEIEGADWLFDSCGVLKSLEYELSLIFGQNTVISTCGSTLCIQTMVAMCRNKVFIAHRNSAHISFFNACALFNAKVHWFGIDDFYGLNRFNLNELEEILKNYAEGSCAIYLTSPDYFGMLAPVEQILKLCKKYNALCLIDCAHGAHLNFLEANSHPASLGVDLCCSSLHKTLPALTGAAVLNFNERLFSRNMVKSAMAALSTTSPSYLIMASIDFCADWLKKSGDCCFSKLDKIRNRVVNKLKLPFLKETDASKLVVDCRNIDLTGLQLAKILRLKKIEPEFADENFVIMILSPFLLKTDWVRLERCLKKINFNFIDSSINLVNKDENDYDILVCREDFGLSYILPLFDWSDKIIEEIDLNEKAVGRICAKTRFKSPPGTVAVAAGERLNLSLILKLKKFGQTRIEVITD